MSLSTIRDLFSRKKTETIPLDETIPVSPVTPVGPVLPVLPLHEKILDVMNELLDLAEYFKKNNMSDKKFSEILKNHYAVLENLTSDEITLVEQLYNDITTISKVLQRILIINTYIEKQHQGGTKKNQKRHRKTQKRKRFSNNTK